jgi:hypothetical protein
MNDTTTIICVVIGAVALVATGVVVAGACAHDGSTPSEYALREKKAANRLEALDKKLGVYNKSRDKAIEAWEEKNPMPELA